MRPRWRMSKLSVLAAVRKSSSESTAPPPQNADLVGVNQPYWQRPRLMRIVRNVGRGNNFAHMTETPPVEWRLTPVGQRYLILRSRRKSRHECCCHGACPLCGMTRLVVRREPSSQKFHRSGGFNARTGSRHLSSSTEESAAGTSSSLPPRRRSQYRRPCGTATLTSIDARAAALIDLHQCDPRADGLCMRGQPQEAHYGDAV
jgi:hypothetical protein